MSRGQQTFLELACGARPVISEGNLEFNENRRYIGVDISSRALGSIVVPKPKLPYASFHLGHAEKLPFADKSVDEVFVADLMGDPSIDKYFLNQKRIMRMEEWIETNGRMPSDNLPEDHPTVLLTLLEAHRVLKDDGRLTILELQTPPRLDFVTAWFRSTGFASIEGTYITGRNPEWRERVAPYRRYARSVSNLEKVAPFLASASKKIVDNMVGEEGLEPSRA